MKGASYLNVFVSALGSPSENSKIEILEKDMSVENRYKKTHSNRSLRAWLFQEKEETDLLLRSIPASLLSLFVLSVIMMNLLANKTLIQTPWIALDGGILISWLSFMCMDLTTKHFGPRAANKLALVAALMNLFTSFIFYIASAIPSDAMDYRALDAIFAGTWFILFGSTVAFLVSAFINNFLNWTIGKAFKKNPDGVLAYATQTYVSTFFGQFVDNLIFSTIVFMGFAPIFWDGFHWTLIQCLTCALTGAIAELLLQVLFSPFGYRILQRWRHHKVGQDYIAYMKGEGHQ